MSGTPGPAPLRFVPLTGLPEIEPGADLAGLIRKAAEAAGIGLGGCIVVVCQKVVSKAENRLVDLRSV
jgi:coenzyme F420-0:L-glutamate ligase/coenzyme F420-1:gamma-L-glutamate ligase